MFVGRVPPGATPIRNRGTPAMTCPLKNTPASRNEVLTLQFFCGKENNGK